MKIDKTNPDLTFYFSFQCPYSYMVWHLLLKLLKNSELTVAPIEIGYSSLGNTKYHFREIWSEERWARLIEDAKKLGLRMSQPSKYVSGLQAARALEVYNGSEIVDYISSVFREFSLLEQTSRRLMHSEYISNPKELIHLVFQLPLKLLQH